MTALGPYLRTLVALAATLPLLVRGAPANETTPAAAEGPSAAKGKGLNYEFHLAPGRIAPDGFERVAILVENKMPGPLIKAQKGDIINVNVVNDLNDEALHKSSSIHWHGIHMLNKNYNDGAATVTQCPIIPNHAYEYTVPTNGQTGTFWYHSHFSSQYCDGLRGPLVIYDPNDPHKSLYDTDDESTIISLVDWYRKPAKAAYHPGPGQEAPRANSTLINGLGIAYGSNGQSGSLAVISVRPGKRYRMRLINMSCDPGYKFSIDGHRLRVIEADSLPVKPANVDQIEIFAGQRYSFILTADQDLGNYWVRALPGRSFQMDFKNNVNTAILRYIGAPVALPTKAADVNIPVPTNPLKESLLEPLRNIPVPGPRELGKADVVLTLETKANKTEGLLRLGDKTFKPPAVPILLQILSGARQVDDMLPSGSLYTLPSNKVIEITLPGDSITGPHPFHLHGHDFWVVKAVDGATPKWTNAIQRDTVNAGLANQSVTIRFVTDNPGPWFLHCHIDWHLDAGLGVVMVEDAKTIANNDKSQPSKEWAELCPIYNKYKDDGGED